MATTSSDQALKFAKARTQKELASVYFEDIAPAQATAQRELNDLALQQQGNEVDRGRQREQQYRQIASKYASRGMRGPTQAVETANYEGDLTKARANEARSIKGANDAYLERFGLAGSEDFANMTPEQKAQFTATNFFDNPTMYGTVGSAARRAALARLQQQGIDYTNVGA